MSTTPALQQQPATATMSMQEKSAFLKQAFENALNKLRQHRNENRRRASYIKVATILLTAIATLLLGLQLAGHEPFQKNAAFAFASLATLLNALEPFYTFRSMWVKHEVAQWKLHRLHDEFAYYMAGVGQEGISMQILDGFHQRYLQVWDELSQSWIDLRQRERS